MAKYKRNCPQCGKLLETDNKHYYISSEKSNKKCLSCSLTGRKFSETHKANLSKNHADVSGERNPFYNKTHSDEVKHKISEVVKEKYSNPKLREKVSEIRKEWHKTNENSFKGKTHSKETKSTLSDKAKNRWEDVVERDKMSQKIIEWHKTNDNPFKGMTHTEEVKLNMRGRIPHNKGYVGVYTHDNETLRKMRLAAIKRIEEAKFNGGQMMPNYNPMAIPIMEHIASEWEITDLQHAENSGEFYIKELGYFVDGYSKKNNIVIEFDEKYHLSEKQKIKDIQRQDMIGQLLKCKFIRIDENNNINIFDYSL
jgi:hypothetical protein